LIKSYKKLIKIDKKNCQKVVTRSWQKVVKKIVQKIKIKNLKNWKICYGQEKRKTKDDGSLASVVIVLY
jgi:hypothetical protein